MRADSDWPAKPLVSALLLHVHQQQRDAARNAVKSLLAQKWPSIEVVVYNSTQQPLFRFSRRRVKEIHLRPAAPAQMLEIARNNCSGEWCLLTHPFCWYDPEYVAEHLRAAGKNRLTTADLKYVYGLQNGELLVTAEVEVPAACFYRFHPVDFSQPLENQFEETILVGTQKPLFLMFAREIIKPTTAQS